jgi:hypothetical protein
LVEKILIYLTLITNLFICGGVIRHWNNMPHQNSTMKAGVSPYSVAPETKEEEEEYQSLEEALTGEKYPEPKGEPSY